MIRRPWHWLFKHPMPMQLRDGKMRCARCGASAKFAHALMGQGDVMRYRLTNNDSGGDYQITMRRP